MKVLLLTFLIFVLSILGLAVGVLLTNRRLKGSCGGLSGIPGIEKSDCSCSNPCEKRKQKMAQEIAFHPQAAEENCEYVGGVDHV